MSLSEKPAVKKDKLNIHAHRLLVLWAVACAEHVLPLFERLYPADGRPRSALDEARRWVREALPMKMAVIRKASLDAHAAARATEDPAARAAARACGQAVATVHAQGHAIAAAHYYAIKAADAAGVEGEAEWQDAILPEELREFVERRSLR